MKPPSFQFYPADWLSDARVQVLSLEEEGAYVRLLCYCWREGSIPRDSSAISQLCKNCSVAIADRVAALFSPDPEDESRLIHKRLSTERTKQIAYHNERSQSGLRGVTKRWANAKKPDSSAMDQLIAKNSSSSSSSSSSVLTPIPPSGGGVAQGQWEPNDIQKRFNRLFNRKDQTRWADKEIRGLKALGDIPEEDLKIVEIYYRMQFPEGKDYRRRDLQTLLNNFRGEVDRARKETTRDEHQRQKHNWGGLDRNAGTYNERSKTDYENAPNFLRPTKALPKIPDIEGPPA